MSADLILARLEGVRRYRDDGWRAKCPAHEGKSPNSLAIKQVDDGRVLLHCFAGCAAVEVLSAIGLELHDLFPDKRPDARPLPSAQRVPRLAARDALEVLEVESSTVFVVASDMLHRREISETDFTRLARAVARISVVLSEVRR